MLYSVVNVIGVNPFLFTIKRVCLICLTKVNYLWNFPKWINSCRPKQVSLHQVVLRTGRQKSIIRWSCVPCRDSQVLRLIICDIWTHTTTKLWYRRKTMSIGVMQTSIQGEPNMLPVILFIVVSGISSFSIKEWFVKTNLSRN